MEMTKEKECNAMIKPITHILKTIELQLGTINDSPSIKDWKEGKLLAYVDVLRILVESL